MLSDLLFLLLLLSQRGQRFVSMALTIHMLSSTGPVEVCTPYEFLCCFSKSVRGLSHFCQVDEREKDAFRKTMPIYRQ